MDEEQDMRKTWSHQFQGKTCGDAVDAAIEWWRRIVLNEKATYSHSHPDEMVVVGPFPLSMRPERLNVLDNVSGVWDITIRWY